jgi:PhnB protein
MISPAIHFPGNCVEAMKFYQTVFPVTDIHADFYRDALPNPGFPIPEEIKDLVMHAEMTICGTKFNMSDTQDSIIAGNMIVFNVFLASGDEVCRAYDKLKEGGKVFVELGPQFFSPMYGSVEDRFGLRWQLIS